MGLAYTSVSSGADMFGATWSTGNHQKIIGSDRQLLHCRTATVDRMFTPWVAQGATVDYSIGNKNSPGRSADAVLPRSRRGGCIAFGRPYNSPLHAHLIPPAPWPGTAPRIRSRVRLNGRERSTFKSASALGPGQIRPRLWFRLMVRPHRSPVLLDEVVKSQESEGEHQESNNVAEANDPVD